MLLVNILVVVGVVVSFSGSGSCISRDANGSYESGGDGGGENRDFVGIGDIRDSRRMDDNKDNNIV